jgi:RNA polymerase sigma-70 factor (ECF subfamily)
MSPELQFLVLRAQTGEREAFELLLRHIQPELSRFVRSVIPTPALADDAVQETLLRIFRKLRWLRDPAVFRAWAHRIAAREAYRLLGRQAETVPLEDVELTEPPPPPSDLLPLIAHVSPASRVVLTLRFAQDMTLEEVADVLAIPLGTVKSRINYGLRQMRRLLEEKK